MREGYGATRTTSFAEGACPDCGAWQAYGRAQRRRGRARAAHPRARCRTRAPTRDAEEPSASSAVSLSLYGGDAAVPETLVRAPSTKEYRWPGQFAARVPRLPLLTDARGLRRDAHADSVRRRGDRCEHIARASAAVRRRARGTEAGDWVCRRSVRASSEMGLLGFALPQARRQMPLGGGLVAVGWPLPAQPRPAARTTLTD
jgi:hypothetical protein